MELGELMTYPFKRSSAESDSSSSCSVDGKASEMGSHGSVNSVTEFEMNENATNSASSVSSYTKDLNNTEPYLTDKKLHEYASRISELLPTYNYKSIHSILCKNRNAENCMELSLWDLLPYGRPIVQVRSEMKHVGDIDFMHSNKENIKYAKKSHIRLRNNSVINSQCTENTVNASDSKHLIKGNEGFDICRDILVPTNLHSNKKSISMKQVPFNHSIQTSQKLRHVNGQKYEEQIKTEQGGKINRNGSINKKTLPFRRNSFQSVTKNSSANQDSLFINYIQYLAFLQKRKEHNVCGNFDLKAKHDIRMQFFQNHANEFTDYKQVIIKSNDSSFRNTSETANVLNSKSSSQNPIIKDPIINMNMSKPEGISTATSSQESSASNFMECLSDTPRNPMKDSYDSPFGCFDSESEEGLLTYPPGGCFNTESDTNQVIGGVKRKQINNEKNSNQSDAKNEETAILSAFQHKFREALDTFPELDKEYIRNMCKRYAQKAEHVNKTELLQKLVAITCEYGELHLSKEDAKESHEEENLDTVLFTYLSDLFPNADSLYLKKKLKGMIESPEKIEDFIQSQCENPTYPTKETELKRRMITAQQQQYTHEFDVKEFLKIFPNPGQHFENLNRKCEYNLEALTFLELYFAEFKVDTLLEVYTANKYHLTQTANVLQTMEPHEKIARNRGSWMESPSTDIPLLQECAFIVHKEKINVYIKRLKEEEATEYEILRCNNALWECQCCYDDGCIPSKCSQCNDGHVFCNSCVLKGTEFQISQGKTRITCFVDCGEEFSLSALQKILSPTQFSTFICKKQEKEVMAAGLEGLVSCPFCHFASIPPPEDKVFKCLNPQCMKESCRSCKKLNHVPFRCYESESEKARILLEEKMSEALLRKCYKCARPYFKVDGCNKITCLCGAKMCYICENPITGYEHFAPYSLCALHDFDLNDKAVMAVAKKTIDYIKKKYPNADISKKDDLPNAESVSGNESELLSMRVRKVTEFDE